MWICVVMNLSIHVLCALYIRVVHKHFLRQADGQFLDSSPPTSRAPLLTRELRFALRYFTNRKYFLPGIKDTPRFYLSDIRLYVAQPDATGSTEL